ncbi:uncharacterized protein (DUF885 family) [Diaminobutyricimonas aerilata]|uniref:Uncharacterized protein (DUF885 family) n=1 Tax=Diaminobutyricimonas aerilata TaxID=1162967 RepID=A0A2M9CK31_9MICO|nr:DUF885 domain-containing protein [Diaminobutyricimonas aerilata]PJJ72240.1 uncharacterized protein (DUF885 family) [Diaminobutyricimonas aerilata]
MTDSNAEQQPSAPSRTPSEIDGIAERWVSTLADLDPDIAIWIGIPGRLDEYADLSPAGHARYIDEAKKVLAELDAAQPTDTVDEVTKTDLSSTLRLDLEGSDAGLWMRDVNVIASPAQSIREVFDLMPRASVDDWGTIARRMTNVPGAIEGYIETLRTGIAEGVMPARRQVREVGEQVTRYAAPDGFFATLAAEAAVEGDAQELPESLRSDLRRGAETAAAAYGRLAEFFTTELQSAAPDVDGVGRDLYALRSRHFLGAEIDLDETYEWGIEELARMVEEQTAIANEILPGATVEEAIAHLEKDESRKLRGTEALREWMQQLSDRAVDELSRSHFDIPDPVKRLECMIAPTQEGGIYYTSPSDDFSRPGRMWWSVPEGVTEFDTWRETTTVYHEGVPGHHLQLGQAVYNRATLNTWRRQLAGTSGHAEGWALYAERLMQDLGYLDDPADRLGMLDGQRMRAARVVLDIGVHLGKPRLDGTGTWDYDYAFEFMKSNVNMNEPFVRFEVNRYFGWPGQAPSYKVGQRIWEQIRDEYRTREGDAFSMKRFHRTALDLGGVGLDTLRTTLLG